MNRSFIPRMDILPPAQQRLWPALKATVDLGFVLYGGTAIALRLGHRQSVDFDFFSDLPLNRNQILAALPFLKMATSIQDANDVWTVLVPDNQNNNEYVKLSFFGSVDFGRVGYPDTTEDGTLVVASLDDLMATKVKVVLQRAEAKDYRDIAAMIKAGISLPHSLAAARCLFGSVFQPSESLKALVYFKDGDLEDLTAEEKSTLIDAVSHVQELPSVSRSSDRLLNS